MRICYDAYRSSGKMGSLIDEYLTKIDIPDNDELEVNIIGHSGQWFGNIEHMKTNILNSDFLKMLSKINNAEYVSALESEFNHINADLIWMLRSATKDGRLILIDKPANILFSETINAMERVSSYELNREKLEELEESFKSTKKEDPENPELDDMAKEIMRMRDYIQVLRSQASQKNFLGSSFIMGALNLIKGFEIEYFDEDLIIAKVTKNYSQTGITMKVIEKLYKIIQESKKKNINDKAKFVFDNWKGSSDYTIQFDAPEESQDLWVLDNLTKLNPISNESGVEMIGVRPVAPMKTHILASVMASGTLGSASQQVLVNGEKYLMKSIMLPSEEVTEVTINGEKIIEKISIWKPKMGVFNLLRKEVNILED